MDHNLLLFQGAGYTRRFSVASPRAALDSRDPTISALNRHCNSELIPGLPNVSDPVYEIRRS
jgi:hypothetical protein